MKRFIIGFVTFCLAVAFSMPMSAASRFIVKYKHPVAGSLNDIVSGLTVESMTKPDIDRLRLADEVEYAAPDMPVYVQAIPTINEMAGTWYLNNLGTGPMSLCSVSFTPGNDHKVLDAWKQVDSMGLTPGQDTVIGMSDTGIFPNKDFDGKILKRLYVRDGQTFEGGVDQMGHGTWTSGIAAAGMNGVRPIGLAYGAKLFSVGFIQCDGGLFSDGLLSIAKLIEAKKSGVNVVVINMSWGCQCDDPDLRKAFIDIYNAAITEDITLVVAAGNGASSAPAIPAVVMKDIDGAISVGAVDGRFMRTYFSNYGDDAEIGAAGCGVIGATTVVFGYQVNDGTSASAPLVSGTVALLKSVRPDLKPSDIEMILKATATHVDGLRFYQNGGILNVNEALNMALAIAH